jgi:hypothetical protein
MAVFTQNVSASFTQLECIFPQSFLFNVYQARNLPITYTEIIREIRYRYLPPAGSTVKRQSVEIVALVWNSEHLPEDGCNR